MLPESTDILRHAIRRLRSLPLPATFALKEKFSGALLDLNALSGRGWRMLTWVRDGEAQLWGESAWLERILHAADGKAFLFHVSFGPANPEQAPAALRREEDFPAFLRRIHVFECQDGGLSIGLLFSPPPDDVLRQLSMELGEAVLEDRPPFAADAANLASDYGVSLPEWDGPDIRNLAIVQNLAWDEWKEGRGDSAERLLAPAVAAVANPEADPEGARILREFPLQSVLWRILYLWMGVSDESAAMRRFLAFLLERVLDDDLDEPLDARGWTVVATALVDAGESAAAIVAFEQAIAADGDDPDFPSMLWSHLRRIANAVGGQTGKGRRPDGLRELVRILVANEELLSGQPGYWSLLGLLFLLHGEGRPLVASTLRKAFASESATAENTTDDDAGAGQTESGAGNAKDAAPKCIAQPLAWQSLQIGLAGRRRLARRQLAVFPEPVLGFPGAPYGLPQHPVAGMGHGDMWHGLDPDFRDHFLAVAEEVLKDGRVLCRPPSIAGLEPHEVSDENRCVLTEIARLPSRRSEIVPLLSLGMKDRDVGARSAEPLRLIPLARPAGTPRNLTAALWQLFPYADNGCGEGLLRLADGRPLCAVLPFYASDRNLYLRGIPCPVFLYATAFTAERLGRASEFSAGGPPIWACSLEPVDNEAGHAVHTAVGVVRSVRHVSIGGIPQSRILRIDLDLFTALPCRLPLYIHESVVRHGPVRRGDLLAATGLLYADLFDPEPEILETWRREHPDGPGEEPRYAPPAPRHCLWEFARETETDDEEYVAEEEKDDGVEPLTPDNLDVIRVALARLRSLPGCEDCRVWPDNPTFTQIACRVNGEIRRFRVFRRMADEPGPAPDETPPGVAPLVVRIVPDEKVYRVVYEGFPE